MKVICGFVAIVVLLTVQAPSQVTYVDVNAMGAQTGASWADAYTDLQTALLATNGGQIWVAQGTYYPGPAGQRGATFQLKSGVALYGGFAGGETALAQRDVAANPTVLSGDIDQNDTYGAGANWWQFAWSGSLGNSYHIVTGSGVDATGVLDGFTILAGRGDGAPYAGGAGLFVMGGSPTIRNCTFRYNAIGFGSSAWLRNCQSTFENCVIKDGYTCNCGIGGWTSGVLAEMGSDVTFTDCDFTNHYYVSAQGQGRGAALSIDLDCSVTLLRCRFVGNQTGNFYPIGGGTAYGGGVYAAGDIVADRCEFLDNFAHAGAGMTAWRNATITNCLFARNEAVPHPNGLGIEVGDYGAGLLTLGFSAANTILVANCTFADNNTSKGGGAAFYSAAQALVRNCIVYDNYADPVLPGEDPIFILKQQIAGNYDLRDCCVEGLLQTEPMEDPPDATNFPGCFDEAPLWVDLAGGDYHLQPASPAIGAGDGAVLPGGTSTFDLDGNPRVTGILDMGCYEFSGAALPSMVSTNLVTNIPASYTIRNANPGETVYLLGSITGGGPGPCLPAPINLCFGLSQPISLVAPLTANSQGTAALSFTLPPGFPTIDVWMQALILRGPGFADSVVTNVIHELIQPQP